MKKQYISFKGHFMAAHRLLNYPGKCKNLHGHNYEYKLTFSFTETNQDLGFAVDFGELKKIIKGYIDSNFDHKSIINPMDRKLIEFCQQEKNEHYIMRINNQNFCNSTAENISKELALGIALETESKLKGVKFESIELWETKDCSIVCTLDSISKLERENFGESK